MQRHCCVDSGLADRSANRIGIVHAEVSNNKAELELSRIGIRRFKVWLEYAEYLELVVMVAMFLLHLLAII